jgi:hypothetical protein
VVDAIKQAMGGFVSFTFSTKFFCGVNQILTVTAVIQIQNLRQAFISKSRDLMWRNVYSVEITYGINSIISKLMTFVENAETGQFLFLVILILSYFTCS